MKNPKYHIQIKQDGNTWTSEIVRKVSKTQSAVSKAQEGFTTEKDALAWGETELESFLNNLSDRNQRKATKRS